MTKALFSLPSIPVAWAAGVIDGDVWLQAGVAVPGVVLGIVLGRRLRPHLPDAWFRTISMALLVGTAGTAIGGAVVALV